MLGVALQHPCGKEGWLTGTDSLLLPRQSWGIKLGSSGLAPVPLPTEAVVCKFIFLELCLDFVCILISEIDP